MGIDADVSNGISLSEPRLKAIHGVSDKLLYGSAALLVFLFFLLYTGMRNRKATEIKEKGHHATEQVASAPAENSRGIIQREREEREAAAGKTQTAQPTVITPDGLRSSIAPKGPDLIFSPSSSTGSFPALTGVGAPTLNTIQTLPLPPAFDTAMTQDRMAAAEATTAFEKQRREAPITGRTNQPVAVAGVGSTAMSVPSPVLPPQTTVENVMRGAMASARDNSLPGAATATAGDLAKNEQFLKPDAERPDDYLHAQREAAVGEYEIQKGAYIPAAMAGQTNSDLPGNALAIVRRDVNDAKCGQVRVDGRPHCYVMIPAGSKLVGEYNSAVGYGQNRVQVVWTRLIFPDTSFIDLGKMNAHSADGSSGMADQTDSHWRRTAGGILLASVLSAGLQISQNHGNQSTLEYPGTGQVLGTAVGQQAGRVTDNLTARNLGVKPTLKIRPGFNFAVYVSKDIVFDGPYKPMR